METSYLWLIPVLPLLGAIITGGMALGAAKSPAGASRGFAALIAVLLPALAFAVTVVAAVQLTRAPGGDTAPALTQTLWSWIAVGGFSLKLGFLFDALSSMMLLFITGIGTLITLYSVGYMWADRGFVRFMSYLNLFLFSMIMLVLGASLPVTFLGWEGVGLCSYLLIGFWHQNDEYNGAAKKAFVVNRIGDLGFLLGAFALVGVVGSMDYQLIAAWFRDSANEAAIAASVGVISLAGILLFVGCTGKSAQIPLLTWLPDAMAGPTPVSALIHAATMVTSGVYLLARLSDVYVHAAPWVLQTVLIIGCATAIFGAIAGLFQNDIKKALAYSTVSQLGFMFMACGVGAFDVGLFHVFTHAFFKATLFLGAGAVIHVLHHEQDLRKMGGLSTLPQTRGTVYFAMFWAWWAILGLPLGAGFFSKDHILESLFASGGLGLVAGVLALATALVTAIYMTRVMYLAFWSPSRVDEHTKHHLSPVPFTMRVPLWILGTGSIVTGLLFWNQLPFLPERLQSLTFANYLAPVLGEAQSVIAHHGGMDHHLLLWLVPCMGTAAAIIGWIVAWRIWGKGPTGKTVAEMPSSAPYGFGAAWTWAFDKIYHLIVVVPTKALAVIAMYADAIIIGLATNLVALSVDLIGGVAAGLQRSRLRSGLAMSLLGVAAILIVLLWNR